MPGLKGTLEALDIGNRTFAQGVIDALTMMAARGTVPLGFVILGFDHDDEDPAIVAGTGFGPEMRSRDVREVAADVATQAILAGSHGRLP